MRLVAVLSLLLASPLAAAPPRQITTNPANDSYPTWAKNGSTLVFESDRNSGWHLYSVPAGGGTETQITFDEGNQRYPSASPDGSRVAYSFTNGTVAGIAVLALTAGPPIVVIENPGEIVELPRWSADGAYIYFQYRLKGQWNIGRAVSTGGELEVVQATSVAESSPVLAPDGVSLAFSRTLSGAYNMVLAPVADPGVYTQVTFYPKNTGPEDFSPGGKRLLFGSRMDGGWSDLYEMDLQTRAIGRVTFDAVGSTKDTYTGSGRYSPNGTVIAFSTRRGEDNTNIWVMDAPTDPIVGDELSVGQIAGLPGTETTLIVDLTSSQPVSALEFRLHASPAWITATEVTGVDRAAKLTVSYNDDGSVHVVAYGPKGETIAPGLGHILKMEIAVDSTAALDRIIDLALTDLVVSAPGGKPLNVHAAPGTFLVKRVPGDINGDNLIDVGDLVRLTEMILGTGDPATPVETATADCVPDEHLDALDLSCLVDRIISSSRPLSLPLAGPWTLTIENHTRVSGFQFRIGSAPVEAESGMGIWSWHEGNSLIMAYDPEGHGWAPGSRSVLTLRSPVQDVRAYGPGGRPIKVTLEEDRIVVGTPVPFSVLPPQPNPFPGATRILLTTTAPAQVQGGVFDTRGRRVASFEYFAPGRGTHEVPWTARDDAGRPLPAGIYYLKLTGSGVEATTRLVNLGS